MEPLTEFFKAVAIDLPMSVAKAIVTVFDRKTNPKSRFWIWLSTLGVGGATGTIAVKLHTTGVIRQWAENPRNLFPIFAAGYGIYILALLPILVPYQYIRIGKLSRSAEEKSFHFSRKQMAEARGKSSSDNVFLGKSMKNRRNIYLSREMRKMHTHIVGSTGAGKTESVILPLLAQDIQLGRGALVMDAKGDRETLNKIYHHVRQAGREKDFLFFSLAYPEKSNTYNPLLRGNPTELKDKIISANVWTEEFYKKKSEETLLLLMKALKEQNEGVTFHKLY